MLSILHTALLNAKQVILALILTVCWWVRCYQLVNLAESLGVISSNFMVLVFAWSLGIKWKRTAKFLVFY